MAATSSAQLADPAGNHTHFSFQLPPQSRDSYSFPLSSPTRSAACQCFRSPMPSSFPSLRRLAICYHAHPVTQNSFNHLQQEESHDRNSLLKWIKYCGREKDLLEASKVHAQILQKRLFPKDVSISNALVSMYARCGSLSKAEELFDQLPVRDVVSWTALISAYAKHGLQHKALGCFRKMRNEGFSPDTVTFICVLKVCSNLRRLDLGEEIHFEVQKKGLLTKDIVLGTALVDMYAKCGVLQKAQEVFELLPARNVVSWTALICGFAVHGLGKQALTCFELMEDEGISPNAVTFICILKACSSISALEMGEEMHAKLEKEGLLEKDIVLGTALVDMYVKCGALRRAQEVFYQLPARNVVSWNALISGYAQHGLGNHVLSYYSQMRGEGQFPSAVTFVCVLQACGSVGSLEMGGAIHAEIQQQGLLMKDRMIGTALVDMYAKCGAIRKAQEVFDGLPVRDVVAWNALMAGFVHNQLGHKAVQCFIRLKEQGLHPNVVTYTCIVKACSNIGSLEMGEEIHDEVDRQGLLEKNVILGTAMVDMYAKCGVLGKAQAVFDRLPTQSVVSWTALVAGHAQLGQTESALTLFEKMISSGVVPDTVTFLVLLSSCSHAGLVEEGQMLFYDIENVYCLDPTLEHYACMVDLFSRAGHFHKAILMIEKVPPSDRLQLWLDFLGACRKWLNVELGKWAFEQSVQLDEKCVPAYICMSNIYAAAGMQKLANEIEVQRIKNEAWGITECSWWTDASRNVHTFVGLGMKHPQSRDIYQRLKEIHQRLASEGYSPRLHGMSQEFPGEWSEEVLCGHSERLAIACALINTSKDTPIRVTRNTRICGDCHLATSMMSKVEKRQIQVRDPNHIHVFDDGRCVCGDYW